MLNAYATLGSYSGLAFGFYLPLEELISAPMCLIGERGNSLPTERGNSSFTSKEVSVKGDDGTVGGNTPPMKQL